MRKLILAALMAVFSFPAYADRQTTSITAINGQSAVKTVEGTGACEGDFKAGINVFGTFNGCDIHWLMSTNDGTTKGAIQYASNTSSGAAAKVSRAFDNFQFEWGCPNFDTSVILYYSVGNECSSAPSLTVNIDDNL